MQKQLKTRAGKMNKLQKLVSAMFTKTNAKKGVVSTDARDKWDIWEDLEESTILGTPQQVYEGIYQDGRQREDARVDVGSGQSHEPRYFGAYNIDLRGEDGTTLIHSFQIVFKKQFGKIAGRCTFCDPQECPYEEVLLV